MNQPLHPDLPPLPLGSTASDMRGATFVGRYRCPFTVLLRELAMHKVDNAAGWCTCRPELDLRQELAPGELHWIHNPLTVSQ